MDWQKEDKLFENQQLFKTPIVRNGKKATVGYQPEIWKDWGIKTCFHKKPPVQVLHSAAGCGILLGRQKTLGDSDQ